MSVTADVPPPRACARRSRGALARRSSETTVRRKHARTLPVEHGRRSAIVPDESPEALRAESQACSNDGVWPVLVGAEDERPTLLGSPIILCDHPLVAPESPGRPLRRRRDRRLADPQPALAERRQVGGDPRQRPPHEGAAGSQPRPGAREDVDPLRCGTRDAPGGGLMLAGRAEIERPGRVP